jgi:hypothetical protein
MDSRLISRAKEAEGEKRPGPGGAVAQTLIGVFFTPMSQSKDCKDTINKEAGVKNTPTSVCFVDFSLWATAPGDPGEAYDLRSFA